MKRMFGAALLALPALLAAAPVGQAQCAGCAAGAYAGPAAQAGGYDPLAAFGVYGQGGCGGCKYLGCGGTCFRHFTHLNQEGPLFNYGPYSGYYPFAPYGPWDEYLRYTGPYPSNGGTGWLCGKCGLFHRGACGGRGGCADGNCGGWGRYSALTFRNVFQRTHPLCHKAAYPVACAACGM